MSEARKLFKKIFSVDSAVLTVIIHFVSFPIVYFLRILFARELGVENYGDFAVSHSLAILGATFAILGLDKAVLKFLPFYIDQKQFVLAKGFIIFSSVFIFLLASILSLLAFSGSELIQSVLGLKADSLVSASLLLIPTSLVIFLVKLLVTKQRAALASFIFQILLPVIIIFLVLLSTGGENKLSESTAINLLVIGRIITLVILLLILWPIYTSVFKNQATVFQTSEWIITAKSFLFTTLIIAGIRQSGTILLEILHPIEADVGIFVAAKHTATFPMLALTAVHLLAIPKLSILLKKGDIELATKQLGQYLKFLVTAGIVALISFWFWGEFFLSLYGIQSENGYATLLILSVGYLFVLAGSLATPVFQILKENRIVFICMLFLLVFYVALSIVLIPVWGLPGAAWAFAVSMFVGYVIQIRWLQLRTGIGYLPALLKVS